MVRASLDRSERPHILFKGQKTFIESDAANLLYAGGFGCGKTDALCIRALILAQHMPGCRGLIGRATYGELQKSTIKSFFDLFPELRDFYAVKEMELRLPNGSEILFQHLDLDERELGKVRNLNLCWFAIDQLEQITAEVYDLLDGRTRQTNLDSMTGKDKFRRYAFSVCNPSGHNWVWQRWVRDAEKNRWRQDALTGRDLLDTRGNKLPDFRLVESTTFDNPLLPKDYLGRLMRSGKSQSWINRYVYGSWEAYEGLVYDTYDAKRHHCPRETRVPPGAVWCLSCDPGFNNPMATVLCALDYDDTLWAMGEVYGERMEPKVQARAIRKMVAEVLEGQDVIPRGTAVLVMAEWDRRPETTHMPDIPELVWADVKSHIRYWVMDPAGKAHTGTGNNLSWFDEFARYRIPFSEATYSENNAGVHRLHERFSRKNPVGIQISDLCPNGREELSMYEWMRSRENEEKEHPEKPRKWKDHWPNALEYASTAFHTNVRPQPENWSSATLEMMMKSHRANFPEEIKFTGPIHGAKHWMGA